ncbi:MAG: outer membrane beta-barrel protein [Arcobacteraceae bacterium]
MKKSLALASMLLAGSLYGASDDAGKLYVGLGYYTGSGTETNDWTGGLNQDTTVDYDATAFPISLGIVTQRHDRFEIVYTNANVDADNGSSYDLRGIDFNYDFTLESLSFKKVLPYIGVGAGIYEFQDSGRIYNIVGGKDIQGVALNLNAGVLYSLTDHIEFEAAYQYKKINWEKLETVNGSSTLEIDEKIHGLYVGFNYKF